MKHMLKPLLLAAMLSPFSALAAMAAERTITLSVPGMYCASCPFIVKGAISRLEGIVAVETDLDARQAFVTFEDSQTSLDLILEATENAGYMSTLAETDGKGSE
ncbi:cation transporter [Maritalea mediterranea]|uniref:Cation transporter n=1 Tax=Maritalea mediterranea TaxID=2909667 RepID=A0ABS9EAI1_9HYPH|nr:cation transporter [Maritalea mediterranea]MCF4098433.1 cation transporter [Maritalea mediterranea]